MDFMFMLQNQIAPWLRAKFGRDERGAALVEYALLVALIAVVCIVALQVLGRGASSKFSTVSQQIGSAGS